MPEIKEPKPEVDTKDTSTGTDTIKTEPKKEPESGGVGGPQRMDTTPASKLPAPPSGAGGDNSEH